MKNAARALGLATALAASLALVAAAVVQAQAGAGAAPSKEELLGRWAAALGGSERLAEVMGYHLRSRISTGGLSGTYDEWGDARGRRKEAVDLGEAVKQENVLAGREGWVRDSSGKVHNLGGEELADVITSAYFASYSFVLPGRMEGQVEAAGEDASGKAYVVKLLPRGGKQATVYLDKSTFFPLRVEQMEGPRTQTTTYSEWRTVDGVKLPGRSVQSTGDPKYDTVIVLEHAELNPAFESTLFAKPAETAPPVKFAASRHEAEFPFEAMGNHILVPARVNGAESGWFIFDTGADVAIFDVEFAKKAQLAAKGALEVTGTGEGSAEIGMVNGVTIGLPGVDVPAGSAAVTPLAPLWKFFGRRIEGILGYDVISRFVVEIDYAGKKIHLHEPAGWRYAGKGAALPITFRSNTPVIHATVTLPGHKPLQGSFTVDTGAGGFLVLNSPFVNANQLLSTDLRVVETPSAGVGGLSKEVSGRVESFQVGPYVMRNAITAFSRDTKGSSADPTIAGNIGGEFLRRFTVIFDYAQQTMYLEPNAHFSDAFEITMSGLFLTAEPPDFAAFKVLFVTPGSAASEAGVQSGDLITAIDGRPAMEIPLVDARDLFRQKGRTVRLTLRRGERSSDVTITLRRMV